MIEALASNGSNHSLHIGSLPRRARCRQDLANAHVSHLFSEVIAKDPIAVPQQVTRELLSSRIWGGLIDENATQIGSWGSFVGESEQGILTRCLLRLLGT